MREIFVILSCTFIILTVSFWLYPDKRPDANLDDWKVTMAIAAIFALLANAFKDAPK